MMWTIDKKLGTAYLEIAAVKGKEINCSDQEAGKDFIINYSNELVGFSFCFPQNWFGPNIQILKETFSNYFDSVVLINGNCLKIGNKIVNNLVTVIESDIIIDFCENEILGLEFLFNCQQSK